MAERRRAQTRGQRVPKSQRHDQPDDGDRRRAAGGQLRYWRALRAPLRFRQGTL